MTDGAFLQAYQALLKTPTLPDLGPGPRAGVQPLARLEATLASLFEQCSVHAPLSQAFRSAALLWHDHLDESHRISQDLPDSDGSYLHALMHRREPDYFNAKYWFRRAGPHPVYLELAPRARERMEHDAGSAALKEKLLPGGKWDPFGFVDLCESAAARRLEAAQAQILVELQAIEFDALVIHLSRF